MSGTLSLHVHALIKLVSPALDVYKAFSLFNFLSVLHYHFDQSYSGIDPRFTTIMSMNFCLHQINRSFDHIAQW